MIRLIISKNYIAFYMAVLLCMTSVYVWADVFPTGWEYLRDEETNTTVITQGTFYKETYQFDLTHTPVNDELRLALIGSHIKDLHTVWQMNLLVMPVLLIGLLWLLKTDQRPSFFQARWYGALYICLLLLFLLIDISFFIEKSGYISYELSKLTK
jgi:hypothetical protein